jgi:hypothetical protein
VHKGCGTDKESGMDKNRKGICELWTLGYLNKEKERTKGSRHFACLKMIVDIARGQKGYGPCVGLQDN